MDFLPLFRARAAFFFMQKICLLEHHRLPHHRLCCNIFPFTLFCPFFLPYWREKKALSVKVQILQTQSITSLKGQKTISFRNISLTNQFNLIDRFYCDKYQHYILRAYNTFLIHWSFIILQFIYRKKIKLPEILSEIHIYKIYW